MSNKLQSSIFIYLRTCSTGAVFQGLNNCHIVMIIINNNIIITTVILETKEYIHTLHKLYLDVHNNPSNLHEMIVVTNS